MLTEYIDGFLTILFVLFFLAAIVGLLAPQVFKFLYSSAGTPPTRVKVVGIFLFMSFVTAGVGGSLMPKKENKSEPIASVQKSAPSEIKPPPLNTQPEPTRAEAAKVKINGCEKDDLQCLGNAGLINAGVYCKDKVEKLAKHSVKWTDGWADSKFSRFGWRNKEDVVITYVGNKIEFQNGFGAFTPMIYECDLASDNKTVLGVRAEEGRLP